MKLFSDRSNPSIFTTLVKEEKNIAIVQMPHTLGGLR